MPITFLHALSWLHGSFLFSAEKYYMVQIYYRLFIHSLTEGHLGYFQIFTVVNKAALNVCA